jgi:hypothetical protein
MEDALARGSGPLPHEQERQSVIARQVEVRIGQAQGAPDPEFDPTALRLMAFAVCSYPRLLPQITRMTTGHAPDSPEFGESWNRFLRQLGRGSSLRMSRGRRDAQGMPRCVIRNRRALYSVRSGRRCLGPLGRVRTRGKILPKRRTGRAMIHARRTVA